MKNLILSIESSSNCCGITIGNSEQVIFNEDTYERHIHDKLLASLIKKGLAESKTTVNKLSAVAISSGPGSFTGLRVGASIAKALTYNNTPKLLSINNLEAFAENAICNIRDTYSVLRVIIKSHKDIYYMQEFDINGNSFNNVNLVSSKYLMEKDRKDILTIGHFPEELNFKNSRKELNIYSSELIHNVALNKFENNDFENSINFTPDYFQDFKPN